MNDKVIRFIIITLFVGSAITVYDNLLFKSMVSGTYVNSNFNYDPFLVEIPYRPDTLILADDGKFNSNYWGRGTYQVTHHFIYTQITLSYNILGKGSITFNMNRYCYWLPQIILFDVEDHAYRKIK